MLNHTRERLLCSITQERDFFAPSQKKETSLNNYKELKKVLKNFSFLRSEKLFLDSESKIVQSLSAADKGKRTEKERTQAIIQVPSTNRK